MGRLKIVADGRSAAAQAEARGKLFEQLMADVLRHYGYQIDSKPNVNYAGMEIDIEGRAIATQIPIYAECKCHETEIDSPKVQAFFGKYMTRWLRDSRCQGLFVALPSVNSSAKGFYRENCEGRTDLTVRLLDEEQVLEALLGSGKVINPNAVGRLITTDMGVAGDWLLLYAAQGLFLAQYITPPGAGIAKSVAFFDARGDAISEESTIEHLRRLYPELEAFDVAIPGGPTRVQPASRPDEAEEVVEVRGSSACFEYQFPASPEYFVGREPVLEELDGFAAEVLRKVTSSRGVVFEGNSGWGKSSAVLAAVDRLKARGHFGIAIDCRSAFSSQFILRVTEHAARELADSEPFAGSPEIPTNITGFEGMTRTFLQLGQLFERRGKVLFIFFDQFESLFLLPDVLRRIRDLLLKICDIQTNVVLGFSWKTDLVGALSDFPFQMRQAILDSSRRIILETFSDVETNALLGKLSNELHARLRKDLRFFLSEFSQGYPWLLKKLCAHVKAQREAGVLQSDIANSLLNIEELFQEDLRTLSAEEEEALKRIAQMAPIGALELGEELPHEVLESLVHRRLVVKIGSKYDVYSDIFRDYLNSGRAPVQENYILRVQIGSIIRATRLLIGSRGTLSMPEFRQERALSEKSVYNVARDMRLLGLATVDAGQIALRVALPDDQRELEAQLRAHMRDRLPRNLLVSRIMEALEAEESLGLDRLSASLAEWCPYVSATEETWRTYARILVDWMDFADLAIWDARNAQLTRYVAGMEVRERRGIGAARRAGHATPCVQYTPVERAAIRIVEALDQRGRIDWSGFKPSTWHKAMATLEDMGFVAQKPGSIVVMPDLLEFVRNPDKRAAVFAERALKMDSFRSFIQILRSKGETGSRLDRLAVELREYLGADWTDGTALTNAKIMLDWARHAGLAPAAFAHKGRGAKKGHKKPAASQMPLIPPPP